MTFICMASHHCRSNTVGYAITRIQIIWFMMDIGIMNRPSQLYFVETDKKHFCKSCHFANYFEGISGRAKQRQRVRDIVFV